MANVDSPLHRITRLYNILSESADAIVRTKDRQELYDSICRIFVEDGMLRLAYVAEVDHESRLARPVAAHGAGKDFLQEPASKIPPDSGPSGGGTIAAAIRTRVYDVCNDIAASPRMEPWHGIALKHGLLSKASFPICLDGKAIAILVLYAAETGYFLDDIVRLVVTVTGNMSFKLLMEKKDQIRIQAEEMLRQNEQRFRNIFTASATGIATSTPQGRFLQANAAYCQMLGYTEEELQQLNFASLTHPDDLDTNLKQRDEVLAGVSDNFVMEKRYVKKNGEVVWTCHSVAAVRALTGEVLNFVVVAEDISERWLIEQKLRKQQAELQTLFDLIPAMIWFKDLESRIIRVNRRAAEASGKSAAEIEGKLTSEVYPLEAEKYYADDLACLQTGAPLMGIVEKLRDSEGKEVWVQTDKVPYRDTDGKIVGIVVMALDVTEKKRAEKRFRRLVDSNVQAVFLWDRQGKVTGGNEAFLKLTGYDREDLESGTISWTTMTPAEYAKLDQLALAEIDSTGVCKAFEKEWIRKDGKRVPIILGAAVFDDHAEEGVGFAIDITERKRGEAALHLRDRAIQALTQGILITDAVRPDQPLIYVSPSFTKLTGYLPEEIIGTNCKFLQGKETDPRAVASLRAAISAGAFCNVEILNYRKDGTPFWNELRLSPVRDDTGVIVQFIGVITDVTERRRIEEQYRQAQKMESIGHLASGIAHDFNNILTVINGYTQLLLISPQTGQETKEFLQIIKEAGYRSSALTSKLLAFGRKQILSAHVVNLNEVVRDIEVMLKRLLGETIELYTSLEPGLDHVFADSTQLDQIILNLAVNARDAMPGGGKLTIETGNVILDEAYLKIHPHAKAGTHVLLAVTDTGSGMTEDVKRQIFEPFFTTKDQSKGTGLGLSVVYGIVKQSGGFIEVYTELGVGTCFKIYLPTVEGAAVNVEKPELDTTEYPRGTETILLVEDESALRELARHILSECGYKVLLAGNGKDGLRVFEQHKDKIKLLLTDVVMPEMGGRILSEKVQAVQPEIKTIFMSGYTDDAVVRHGILHDKVNFLQKPFLPLALARKVREVLG